MKHIFLCLLVLNTNLFAESQENKAKVATGKKTEDNTHVILARIASFVTFFSNIIANPNDSKSVATSILGMISTIFSLAADTRSLTNNQIKDLNLDLERVETILKNGDHQDITLLQEIINKYCELQIRQLEAYKS